jgi:hypothetical protein
MDDPDKRGPADRMRINVNEAWEVRYWTAELGCSEEQLRRAVESVGPMRDGQIVEQGSHEQLLASGGAYAELYAAQFSGAAVDLDTGEAPAPDLAGAKV